MERLIVEAVSNEKKVGEPGTLNILVSVCKASDGNPITKLTSKDFTITNFGLKVPDNSNASTNYTIYCTERTLDPKDSKLAGVYDVNIRFDNSIPGMPNAHWGDLVFFNDGDTFAFGLQVKYQESFVRPGVRFPYTTIFDFLNRSYMGQTVVSVISRESWAS